MCLREKIGPDPRNFNQRVSLGRNDLLIRTFLSTATVNVIATKTQGNKSVGGTVKQKVVNNASKKTESDGYYGI
jgi:hypothetical protein